MHGQWEDTLQADCSFVESAARAISVTGNAVLCRMQIIQNQVTRADKQCNKLGGGGDLTTAASVAQLRHALDAQLGNSWTVSKSTFERPFKRGEH